MRKSQFCGANSNEQISQEEKKGDSANEINQGIDLSNKKHSGYSGKLNRSSNANQ
jgi:hypothetical protein